MMLFQIKLRIFGETEGGEEFVELQNAGLLDATETNRVIQQ